MTPTSQEVSDVRKRILELRVEHVSDLDQGVFGVKDKSLAWFRLEAEGNFALYQFASAANWVRTDLLIGLKLARRRFVKSGAGVANSIWLIAEVVIVTLAGIPVAGTLAMDDSLISFLTKTSIAIQSVDFEISFLRALEKDYPALHLTRGKPPEFHYQQGGYNGS